MLKSLELIGFKSFADKTAFDFSAGITGVVGPNGSGKSNVVDSIKWILGDQSARSLRGKEMSDVIFNGSSSRGGSPYAEAALIFDNTTNFLPVEQPEVRVGRRLWRSGDSEYLINGATARLRDVRNLFMGTGAGASSYCIIEQGRVSQILQTNAASRRLVFEEAAGISRYQARRTEALRKLERVEQHVARLTDIVDEAESRLSAVRTQAARAAKFREVRTELRQLWMGLAADGSRRLTARHRTLTNRSAELNTALETVTGSHQELESERLRTESELAAISEDLRTRERARNELQSRIASLQTTVRHEQSRRRELEAELNRLRRQHALLQSRTREAEHEQKRTRGVLEAEQQTCLSLHQRLETAADEYAVSEQEIQDQQARLESGRNALMQQLQDNTALESRMSSLESGLEQCDTDATALDESRAETMRQIEVCTDRCREQREEIAALEEEVAAADDGVRGVREERDSLIERQRELDAALLEARETRSGSEARMNVLEDLEQRQEGLRIGPREILKRARASSHAPWNSIIGNVADLLDVELDNAALLEVALGERGQLIVVSSLGPLVDYVNSGRCRIEGRVGFVALDEMDAETRPHGEPEWNDTDLPSDHAALPDLSDKPGIVGPAADLARCAPEATNLADYLLADTWIVETLNDALRLRTETRRHCRFVTLQGELLDADGTLYTGIQRGETAVFSRKSELRKLKGDLVELGRRIEHLQRDSHAINDQTAEASAALETAIEESRLRSKDLAELKAALGQSTREHDRLTRQGDDYESRTAILNERRTTLENDLATAREELAAGTARIDTLRDDVAACEAARDEARSQLDSLARQRSQAELAQGKQQERFNGLRENLRRMETDCQQRLLQQQEAERRVQTAKQRTRDLTFATLAATGELAGLYENSERIAEQIRDDVRQQERVRSARADVGARETELSGQRRELATELHAIELETGTLAHQLETLEARIFDEFQTPLSDAVDAGESAVASLIDPRPAVVEEATPVVEEEPADPADEDGEESSWTEGVDELDDDAELDEAITHTETPEASPWDPVTAVLELDDDEFQEIYEELEGRVERLRRRLRNMGNVSTESLENLDELEQRFGGLSSQLQDLIQARDTLEAIVRRINTESKRMFATTFESIRGHFQDLFRKLFGGGEGDVILEDPDDVLECGIEIVARPPGKELRSIGLLSGGEKTMTAVALLLAIFRSRPSPFCILDEVDAALDEANVDRFVQVLREFQETTQFIMITHRKPSMAVADVIYGVTMEESGVSKRLTVRFEDVNDNGEFTVGSGSDAAERDAA